MAEQAIRKYWTGLKGRVPLNINWDAVGTESTVVVTASEYVPNARDPQAAQRFVGSASIVVRNVSPHGPPYDSNRGVTFVVDVQWPQPLNIVTDVAILSGPGRAQHPPLVWRRVNVAIPLQQQNHWCWAAVSTGVAAFYGTATTQCAVANGVLGRTDCCGGGAAGACNVDARLSDALTQVGHLASFDDSGPTLGLIRQEVDANRPFGVRVAWTGGGAHFFVVDGYLPDSTWVAVDDPWFGASDLLFSALQTTYQGGGSLTHHYFTS